jgi:hypothetical protein
VRDRKALSIRPPLRGAEAFAAIPLNHELGASLLLSMTKVISQS